jgi:hypothetical protein
MQAGVFDVARAEGGTRLFEMRVIGWVLMVENGRKKLRALEPCGPCALFQLCREVFEAPRLNLRTL